MISALCWRWSCSQRAGRREAVKEWGTVLGSGEQQPGEVLQGTGLVQPANPDRVVAGVGDELPGDWFMPGASEARSTWFSDTSSRCGPWWPLFCWSLLCRGAWWWPEVAKAVAGPAKASPAAALASPAAARGERSRWNIAYPLWTRDSFHWRCATHLCGLRGFSR